MGVRGLTTFIANRSDLYLSPYQLYDTHLIVDGNNVASHLFKWVSKADSAFGGDYDEYYHVVHTFFLSLKKCNVSPIVLFDGGYEQKKVRTVISRLITRLLTLNSAFSSSYSSTKFFSLFMKQTFWDVMVDLQIPCIQCDFEADNEIAAVARHLQCPVLSYDSDFFIYNVLYIPFSTVCLEPVKVEESEKYCITCSVYDIAQFLKGFEGLHESLLPLTAILVGNDYIKSSIFHNFFQHLKVPKSKNMSYTERKIIGILDWLRKETLDSATENILSHVRLQDRENVLKAMNSSVADYTSDCSETTLQLVLLNITQKINKVQHVEKSTNEGNVPKLPLTTLQAYHKCQLPSFIFDMLTLNTYFSPLQVEDVTQPSAHTISMSIIKAICDILTVFTKKTETPPLKMYLRLKRRLVEIPVERGQTYLGLDFSSDVLDQPKNKLAIFCQILKLSVTDVVVCKRFPESWTLFYLGILFWLRELNNQITAAHMHSVLLNFVYLQVVQKKVGYFKTLGAFMKKKASTISRLKKNQSNTVFTEDLNIKTLLESITELDCLLLSQTFIPLHSTSEKAKGKSYSLSTVHLFASLQSCLYHILYLNALLNFPFKSYKVADCFSGTLLYNLFMDFKKRADVDNYISLILEPSTLVKCLYKDLCSELKNYFPKVVEFKSVEKEKPNAKKRKSKSKVKVPVDIPLHSNETISDSDHYDDVANPFYYLQTQTRD